MSGHIICGDALTVLKELPDESVQMCVTSPPYYGLRDYGIDGQIGLEQSPETYVNMLLGVFREVRRILKSDGTLWLNISDSYAAKKMQSRGTVKPKDMIGIPWLLAFALRNIGWYLRSDIIWNKKNCMPEPVKGRPSKCYEHIFLLSKSKKYYYDYEAIAEPVAESTVERNKRGVTDKIKYVKGVPGLKKTIQPIFRSRAYTEASNTRNKRDVWSCSTNSYRTNGHFAIYPEKLIEPCILAGCPKGGIVLDPFFGSGTTGAAAKRLGRGYIGIDLNPSYCDMARKRIEEVVEVS